MTLKELRQQRKMTAFELAEAIGVTVRALRSYEQGVHFPPPRVAERIAAVFDLSIEEMWQMLYANKPTDVA